MCVCGCAKVCVFVCVCVWGYGGVCVCVFVCVPAAEDAGAVGENCAGMRGAGGWRYAAGSKLRRYSWRASARKNECGNSSCVV